jgi:hypothetical protein
MLTSADDRRMESVGMLPMSAPNGSTTLADGDEFDIASPRAIPLQPASLRQASVAMEKR